VDPPQRPRHLEVLNSIVRAYIQTGEPVGSRYLSTRCDRPLSPATLRNIMADLADQGYLSQPHTSAGRVPTEKAFQCFVSSLTASRIAAGEAERWRDEFRDLHTLDAGLERSSHMLMVLTHNMGIAAAIPTLAQELDQIELSPLADRRVLMVLATRDHIVRHRVVALDEPATPEELLSIRNYINRNFSGWRLGDARRELLRRMIEERELYDAALRKLQLLYEKGMLDADVSPDVHTEGASNLLGLGLRLTREKMRVLLRALEEKERVIELLDRFLEQPPGELAVHVGLREAHPAMRDLALIGMTVQMGSGLPAKVAVLGPMRMHYGRAMAAVLETSRALESARF
jgi:heat-inducible transcriptional repressor